MLIYGIGENQPKTHLKNLEVATNRTKAGNVLIISNESKAVTITHTAKRNGGESNKPKAQRNRKTKHGSHHLEIDQPLNKKPCRYVDTFKFSDRAKR